MFTVSVETRFHASHQLKLRDGSKEPLHRHDWSVIAQVSSRRLNSVGVVIDFRRLKEMLDEIVAELDGAQLNKARYFQQNNSSAENVAKHIYETLGSRLPEAVKLNSIKVFEAPGCGAEYSK